MIWYREYAWFVSDEDGSIFKHGGCNQDFPKGRSLHYNGHRTMLTYINDEDHIKIVAQDHGLNLVKHYSQIQSHLKTLGEQGFEFSKDDRFGYCTTRLQELGSGMRVSVHLKLPQVYR